MKKTTVSEFSEDFQASCIYCGATVGQISGRTEEEVHTVYECVKCDENIVINAVTSTLTIKSNDAFAATGHWKK